MKRFATFVFAMLLTGGLALAQSTKGTTANPVNRATTDTGKDTDKKKAHKGGTKGHKGGKKSKKGSTPNPPTTK